MAKIRIGTRSSTLARWQADWTAQNLRENGHEVDLIYINTSGDTHQGSIRNSSERGLFTKQIQHALCDDQIDLAVHSLKDLPTEKIDGLVLTAVSPREQVNDILISNEGLKLSDLPPAAKIGTGSYRRQAQLKNFRPDFEVLDIRGNVETRIRKCREEEFDAIILAYAGVHRLEMDNVITEKISTDIMLPAVGQAAIGWETRIDDTSTREALEDLNDEATFASVTAERAMLKTLRGGCLAPVAALGQMVDGQLNLKGTALTKDGSERADGELSGDSNEAEKIGVEVGNMLIALGALEYIGRAF